MLICIKQLTSFSFLTRLLLLYMLSIACCPEISGQHQKTLALIDQYYYAGQFEKSKWLTDSIEAVIRNEKGDTSLYYGEFVASYPSMVYQKNSDFRKAEHFYKKGMEIIKKAAGNFTATYAEACVNLSTMYNEMGLNVPALPYIHKGLEILSTLQLRNTEPYAAGTNTLANIYSALGEYNKAVTLYDYTLVLIDSLIKKNPMLMVQRFTIYNNIGAMYEKIGDFEKFAYYSKKALSIGKKFLAKKSIEYNTVLNNYGMAIQRLGYFAEGINILKEAKTNLQTSKSADTRTLSFINNNIADALKALGKSDSSLFLSETLIEQARFGGNTQSFEYYSLVLNYVTTLMSTGNWVKADSVAIDLFRNVTNNKQFADNRLKVKAMLTLSEIYLHTKRYQEALSVADNLQKIVEKVVFENYEILPEQEKMAIISSIQHLTRLYGAGSFGMGIKDTTWIKEWYLLLNRYKNLLFKKQRAINQQLRSSAKEDIKSLYESWKNNRQFLSVQYKLAAPHRSNITDSIEVETDNMERRLNEAAIIGTKKNIPATYDSIIRQLASRECLIQFIRFMSADINKITYSAHYGAFIIRKDNTAPVWIYLCKEKELKQVLKTSPSGLISKNAFSQIFIDPRLRIAGKKYAADKLYQLLWKPLESQLQSIKTIYCISDGLITLLPIHALPVNNTSFLADKFLFRYRLTTEMLLAESTEQKDSLRIGLWRGIRYFLKENKSQRPAIAGNKKMDWRYLRWSASEIMKIRELFKSSGQVQVFDGPNATEENFIHEVSNSLFEIVHLSTHGYFGNNSFSSAYEEITGSVNAFLRPQNPLLNCGLVMAGANNFSGDSAVSTNRDGLLTGYEITHLPMDKTKLIVLSACETGLGSISETEGVFGLQRAFKLAGVGKIIMSLWQVPDKQTSELMILFYSYLIKNNSIETAFEKAQRTMRKKYPSPYFWAGFLLIE